MVSPIAIGPIMLAVDRGLVVICVAAFLGLPALAGRSRFPRRRVSGGRQPANAFVAADGTIVQLQLGELSCAALADGIDMARKR